MIYAYLALLFYLTWVFFGCVMRLREVRDLGLLKFAENPVLFIFAYFTLIVGLVLDVLVNFIIMTPLLFELPKELLTTARLCRWYNTPDINWFTKYWRKGCVVKLGEALLNTIDPDMHHIH